MSEIQLPEMEWDDFETQFPHLFIAASGSPRLMNSLIEGLETIKSGHEDGGLRNTNYQTAKGDLSRIVERAWSTFFDSYITELRNRTLPLQTEEFMRGLSPAGLNEFRFLGKKIEAGRKAGASGAIFDELVSLEEEIAPLANLVIAMKNTVIKGRAPREVEAKIDNPHQVRGTCACCFSNQAVVGVTMAHHGYQRPGDGFQTASCPGIQFQPFEKSPQGTIAVHQSVLARIDALASAIAHPPETLVIQTSKSILGPRGRYVPEEVEINADDPRWANALQNYIRKNKNLLERAVSHRDYLKEKIDGWAPVELKTVMGLPAPEGIGGKIFQPEGNNPLRRPAPTP